MTGGGTKEIIGYRVPVSELASDKMWNVGENRRKNISLYMCEWKIESFGFM